MITYMLLKKRRCVFCRLKRCVVLLITWFNSVKRYVSWLIVMQYSESIFCLIENVTWGVIYCLEDIDCETKFLTSIKYFRACVAARYLYYSINTSCWQKNDQGSLDSARRAAGFVRGDDVLHKIFTELAYRYKWIFSNSCAIIN